MNLTKSGRAGLNGIALDSSSLTAKADLSLLQSGTVGAVFDGISLSASDTGAGQGMSLAAGANSKVTIKTNNQKLSLNTSDNFAVTSGQVWINLGTGAMVSKDLSSTVITVVAEQYTLKTLGLDVYYTGATTDNSAKINVGSGSFTRMIDNSSITAATTLGSSFTAPTYSGLTVTGTGIAASRSLVGVIYGGSVTLSGVTATGAGILNYIEATSFTSSTSASVFCRWFGTKNHWYRNSGAKSNDRRQAGNSWQQADTIC